MEKDSKERTVKTAVGERAIDNNGSPIGISRMETGKSYEGVDRLLQKFIQNEDEKAWEEIKIKIDYTYENTGKALSALDRETDFISLIKNRLSRGQKILFKPNLVSMENIDPYTYGPTPGSNALTDWTFVAAVMRWFHDQAGISYYQMSLGEAATAMSWAAAKYTHIKQKGRVTTEAAIEGKSDNFYGGWGFYFVRKYLAESSEKSMGDDPMNGLAESMEGLYLPPGEVHDKLMIYDLNRIADDPSKGRDIPVPGGENFKTLTLHKAIVGGDPSDKKDRSLYPGAVLINLPKLKVHAQAMFTNAIKNLGIGLYPMEASHSDACEWKYANPDCPVPGLKGMIPHQVWVPEIDPHTCIPKKDESGDYIVRKTGGLTGTMLDIIRALLSLDIFVMHIVDGIQTVNRDHQGIGLGVKEPEGLVIAGLDTVATDLLCARYIFSNVGLKEAEASGMEDGMGGVFPQSVPVPRFDGKAIFTDTGYDCPIQRDACLRKAEKEGMGRRTYYVVGYDNVSGNPMVSVKGRPGFIQQNTFTEIYTGKLYWDIYKMPWDLQKTFFGYLQSVDELEGTSLKKEFLETFDENGDGRVTYEEYGKKGLFGPTMYLSGNYMSAKAAKDESETFRTLFTILATPLRCSNPDWNPEKHHLSREQYYGSVAVVAMMMSQFPKEMQDLFYPDLLWGKGKWPSFSFASSAYIHQSLYGWKFPSKIGIASMYGNAFCYADYTQNNRQFVGRVHGVPNSGCVQSYIEAVRKGEMDKLDFTLYVPRGFGAQGKIPNVLETAEPEKILTVEFAQGSVRWPDARVPVL